MNKLKILALLPLILFAIPAAYVPRANAALMGTVCIAAAPGTTCPATPVHFPGQAPGTTLAVAVSIAGSDSMGGAQVSVVTNPAILNPVSISTTGTVIPAGFTLVNCVNGIPAPGGNCETGIDGIGVASYGQVGLSVTVPPTTGLLFTINYNVMSASFGTIDFVVNSQCSTQSVSLVVPGDSHCILITAGAATDPEFQQGGTYGNVVTPPMITAPTTAVGTVGTTLTVPVIASDSNAAEKVTLTAAGLPAGALFTTSGTNPVNGLLSWTPTVGQQSFTATFTATDNESPAVSTSASTMVSSAAVAPRIVSVHEAHHHLNLAKIACLCQNFTATVQANNLGTIYVQVHIIALDNGGLSVDSAVTPLTGITSLGILMASGNLTPNIGGKFHWTATLTWGLSPTALTNAGSNSKSSAFAVV